MRVPALRFKNDKGQDFPDWEERALEQLALVERGKFSARPRNDPKYFGGTIPFIQTGDVVFSGLFLNRFSQTLNNEGLRVSKLFPKNTVLITIAANIGDTTITQFDIACPDSVVAIQPFNNETNPVWLKFSFDTKKEELDSKATQNAQKNINLQILKPLLFNTPTFQEQTKIANFLTAVDEKISQLTQKHDLLIQYKKGVMQQIFSQELRFKDKDGEDFPEWEKKTLGEIGVFQTSSIDKLSKENETEVFLVNYMNVYRHENLNGESIKSFQVVTAKSSQIESCNLKKGDILFTPSSETPDDIGHSVVIFEDLKNAVFSYHLMRFRPKQKIDILYSHYFCNIPSVLSQLTKLATGSTRFTISVKSFSSIALALPCLAEQTKIAHFLKAIDEKITAIQTQLQAVKQYKQGLLQQMFV